MKKIYYKIKIFFIKRKIKKQGGFNSKDFIY